MIKKLYYPVLGLLLLLAATSFKPEGKNAKSEGIKWLTLEEAAVQTKKQPKKIFIDVYTDWCGWCKKMDQNTFSDPKVVAYVSKNFYAVKLDAESRKPITINGKTYNFNAKMRAHEAALALLKGQMSYPTTVYLDENLGLLSPVPGYLDVPTFQKILTYFGEDIYKKKTYAEYTGEVAAK